MKKIIMLFGVALFFAFPAMAGETVKISVNGLVCDFCARAVEKVFGKEDAVEKVTVDLTAKLITAQMKDGKTLSDESITKMIADSGYALVRIEREAGHE